MSTDPSVELLKAILGNMLIEDADWALMSMVLDISEPGVTSTTGVLYGADGASSPTTVSAREIADQLKAYLDSYFSENDALPVALLVQFERATGSYQVIFEDNDETRWKLTPSNFDTYDELLRPQFN